MCPAVDDGFLNFILYKLVVDFLYLSYRFGNKFKFHLKVETLEVLSSKFLLMDYESFSLLKARSYQPQLLGNAFIHSFMFSDRGKKCPF